MSQKRKTHLRLRRMWNCYILVARPWVSNPQSLQAHKTLICYLVVALSFHNHLPRSPRVPDLSASLLFNLIPYACYFVCLILLSTHFVALNLVAHFYHAFSLVRSWKARHRLDSRVDLRSSVCLFLIWHLYDAFVAERSLASLELNTERLLRFLIVCEIHSTKAGLSFLVWSLFKRLRVKGDINLWQALETLRLCCIVSFLYKPSLLLFVWVVCKVSLRSFVRCC